MAAKRVIVAGSGIGGSAAALAAHYAGMEVEVWERHPAAKPDRGAFLTIASGGVTALRVLGVLDAVDLSAAPLTTFCMQDVAGNTLKERALGDGSESFRLITRHDLCAALQCAVQDAGIASFWGRSLKHFTSRRGGGVTVEDQDGASESADLLVAAEGLRSTARAVLNPPEQARARYVGQNIYYGWSPVRPAAGREHGFHPILGRGWAFGYIPTAARSTWWFARLTRPEQDEERPDYSPLAESLEGLPAEIAAASTQRWVVNAWDLPTVGSWSQPGVVLLGDAAHAASPATGQGASMALEDAVVLGKALRDQPDSADAVRLYCAARRGRTQANIVESARQSTPDNPLDWAPQGVPLSDDDLREQLAWFEPLRPTSCE